MRIFLLFLFLFAWNGFSGELCLYQMNAHGAYLSCHGERTRVLATFFPGTSVDRLALRSQHLNELEREGYRLMHCSISVTAWNQNFYPFVDCFLRKELGPQ